MRLVATLAVVLSSGIAWAGEETARSSEAGAPAPPTIAFVQVISQHVGVTLLPGGPRGLPEALIRVEYRLRQDYSFDDPIAVDITFPVCYPGLPSAKDIARGEPVPRAYAKLDGTPLELDFVTYLDLVRPIIGRWHARIDSLLEGRPGLQGRVMSIRQEAANHDPPWLIVTGVKELRLWMWRNLDHGWRDEHQAYLVARGLLASALPTLAEQFREVPQVRTALRWLDPEHEHVDLYDHVSKEWSHHTLLLDPATAQLVDARSVAREHRFGAFRFQITLQPNAEHELVVEHRQPLGYVGWDRRQPGFSVEFAGLRYVLTHARTWTSWWTPTVEVRAPQDWEGITLRPPATEVIRKDGTQIHRVEFQSRPVEEFYVSITGWPP